jgi:hypothetical protein
MALLNFIKSVTPIDEAGVATGAAVTDLPIPTSISVGVRDVGGSSDRRAASYKARNKRKGMIDVINVDWTPITFANAAKVLQAFASKYLEIEYINPKTGTWEIKQFILDSQRELQLKDMDLELWESAGFVLEQRIPDYD